MLLLWALFCSHCCVRLATLCYLSEQRRRSLSTFVTVCAQAFPDTRRMPVKRVPHACARVLRKPRGSPIASRCRRHDLIRLAVIMRCENRALLAPVLCCLLSQVAVCNLASISLPAFVSVGEDGQPSFDFQRLYKV